jgi:hypothetical protein
LLTLLKLLLASDSLLPLEGRNILVLVFNLIGLKILIYLDEIEVECDANLGDFFRLQNLYFFWAEGDFGVY